jgi:Cdc6-like AAA superfamily ATPase
MLIHMSAYPALDALFGLDREKAISESGVRDVFTPHQPIDEFDLLVGRSREVQKMVATLNTPGQHVLVYGQRGVGKSSLANVVSMIFTGLLERRMFIKRCDRSDTFESILLQPLMAVGENLTLTEVTEENESSGGIDLKLVDGAKSKKQTGTYKVSNSLSPSTVAEAIHGLDGLLVIDEVDALGDPNDKFKLAELIKLLSDYSSKFKIILLGIASTSAELTSAHPSVQRCLRETKLDRISDPALREIVTTGAKRVGLAFTPKVTHAIVRLSAGYPYFTHLIALKCAEEAIGDRRTDIRDLHLADALSLAVADAEETLKRAYDTAVRSSSTEKYRHIVVAASSLKSEEFSASDLREAIQAHQGEKISQGSLNNFLKRLLSNDGASILRRTAKGVYTFSDPRMASFTRMVNAVIDD